MDENKLRKWLQTYAIAWSKEGPDMKNIMLKALDDVFEDKENKPKRNKKKYHEELKELSEKLHEYPGGYGCGKCDECEDMYKTFMRIVKKIRISGEKGK